MTNKELFLKEFIDEIWNKKNTNNIKKYIHKQYKVYLDEADPWEWKTLSNQDFKDRLNYSFNSFPDINFEITSTIWNENNIAATWILTGTNIGNIWEYPPTNKPIKTQGITIYHFKDNLISGHTQVFDRLSVMKQLGFIK